MNLDALRTYLPLAIVLIGVLMTSAPFYEKYKQSQDVRELVSMEGAERWYVLSDKHKEQIKTLVYAHCTMKYHRDSCLHYYITCGRPCKELLSPRAKSRMTKDYKFLMKYKYSQAKVEE